MSHERVAAERAAVAMEQQADACERMGSPLYAALLVRVADDVRAGGPCANALAAHQSAPFPDAIALRLMGAVHALVLAGRAPELADCYSTCCSTTSGDGDPARAAACWPAFRAAVAAELPWIHEWMRRIPQTNDVGRANPLITGLLAALSTTGPIPVRLLEIGCSAGLNLRADRFRYTCDHFSWGPGHSPVALTGTWAGRPPAWLLAAAAEHPTVTIAERRGCDLSPVDPLSTAGILALHAYVWADQADRKARLAAALRLAAEIPVQIERKGAVEFLRGVTPVDGTLTVVWHSALRQYVPASEWALVAAELGRLAAQATGSAHFAHIAFEPRGIDWQHDFQLTLRQGRTAGRILATADPHGIPAHSLASPGPHAARAATRPASRPTAAMIRFRHDG